MYFTWLLQILFFFFFGNHTSHHKYLFCSCIWVYFLFFFFYAFIKALKLCTLVFLYTGKVSVSLRFIKSNQYYLSFPHFLSFLFSSIISTSLLLTVCYYSVISWAFFDRGWTDLYEMMLFLVTWWYFFMWRLSIVLFQSFLPQVSSRVFFYQSSLSQYI